MTLRAHTNAFESICSATAMECSQIADDCRSMLRAAIPPFAGWSGAYIARCADLTAITNCLTRSSENCLNSQPKFWKFSNYRAECCELSAATLGCDIRAVCAELPLGTSRASACCPDGALNNSIASQTNP